MCRIATVSADGIRVRVRLTPRAGGDSVGGVIEDGAGGSVLAVRVAAPPVDGAANRALESLLARTLGVPPGAVRVTSGAIGRIKTLEVRGDPARLEAALRSLAGG